MTERHEALVTLYYQMKAALAENDPSDGPSGATVTDPKELGAYLAGLSAR